MFNKYNKVANVKKINTHSADNFEFQIIETATQLEELEKTLVDVNKMNMYIDKLSSICGRIGIDNGLNNC